MKAHGPLTQWHTMSDDRTSADAWICEHCGSIATGAMCMQCGASEPARSPSGPEPGSYFNIVGFHTFDGFKWYGLLLSLPLLFVGVATSQIGFLLLGLLFASPFWVPAWSAAWRWLRRNR